MTIEKYENTWAQHFFISIYSSNFDKIYLVIYQVCSVTLLAYADDLVLIDKSWFTMTAHDADDSHDGLRTLCGRLQGGSEEGWHLNYK